MSKKKWFTTLKILAAYLVAAWTFLQFVDWVLIRYNISPYWVDVLLWFFIGIIPSLIIYLYHQERINKRILKLREKIIFPLNIIILVIALYFGFGNADLGATTKKINYTDEQGEAQSVAITKEEFRIGVPVYGFENLSKDDESIDWMRYGIGRLLVEDLHQNKSISPDFSHYTTTSTKIEEASLFNNFYIDGEYQKNGEEYTITAYKRKANNGKILAEKTVTGNDFLSLIDELTVFITENSGFVESNSLRYLDYPINEFMSDSLNAIKEFIQGDYSKAVAIDERFALAYLEYAKRSMRFNKGKLEVQDLTNKAFQYRNRLPLQKQLEVNIQRNLAFDNYEDAIRQVQLQLEVDPHNDFYNQVLFSIYGETKETQKYMESSDRLFKIDPNAESGTNMAVAAIVNAEDDLLINEIKKYELISPNLKVFRLQPLLFKGEVDKAEVLLNEIKTLYPGWKNRWPVYDSVIQYLKNNPYNVKKLKKFEGTYRASFNEQEYTYWIDNNRLIQYVKNQRMDALLPAGENSVATGFVNNTTWKNELIFNDTGKVIGMMHYQYNYNNTGNILLWKEDESIEKAFDAFEKRDFEQAEQLYQIAIAENPEHEYLKNNLKHIQYLKTIGSDSLTKQNERFAGTYGQREFWIDNGRFFYKRQGENVDLPRYELLAIDENSYMDVTRANTVMEFVIDSTTGKMASTATQYNFEQKKWITSGNSEETTNYFLKND